MNLWQYLNNRSKRKYIMKQLNYYRKERTEYSLIWEEITPRLTEAHLGLVKKVDMKIAYYEDKLNEQL